MELKQIERKIKKLQKELQPLINKRNKIREHKSYEERIKHVGRCFKYLNSYSSGEKWWLYIKIIEADTSYGFKTLEFQEAIGGIEPREVRVRESRSPSMVECDSYIPIPEKEFSSKFAKIMKKLADDNYVEPKQKT